MSRPTKHCPISYIQWNEMRHNFVPSFSILLGLVPVESRPRTSPFVPYHYPRLHPLASPTGSCSCRYWKVRDNFCAHGSVIIHYKEMEPNQLYGQLLQQGDLSQHICQFYSTNELHENVINIKQYNCKATKDQEDSQKTK